MGYPVALLMMLLPPSHIAIAMVLLVFQSGIPMFRVLYPWGTISSEINDGRQNSGN